MVIVGSAAAGGLERGGYNIDLLFDPSRFAAEATGTYVMPDRKLDNVVDSNPFDGSPGGKSDGVRDTADYWVPRVGVKFGAYDAVDCMLDYSQPWGAHTNPGLNWAGANYDIETKVNSDNYAGTCSYKFQAGKGELRLIGGAFYQELDGFQERLVQQLPPAFGSGIGRLDLSADGWGWRAGVAYEIEEIAFRASLVYNSEVKLGEITGTLDLTQIPGFLNPANPLLGRVTDVFGEANMPQSVELKVQSGIAPGWLAFGSIKWVDWSVLQSVAFCPTAAKNAGLINSCSYYSPFAVTSLDLLYRDGWTVQGGVGHRFSDQISGAASITWDRGTSTGLGTQTDTWTFSAGGSYTPNQNVEIRLGGALGILTSGSQKTILDANGQDYGNNVTYDFGNDLVSALSASLKVKF
ncbi:OmpP1/FadL family transporter [Mesorhizobium sp. CN2-181]|uniref:OmpP1/FadL family transporter n=1 Tax=Mesorhizobium yinganensis TaxID=3157707 RepID=UPI0032B73149